MHRTDRAIGDEDVEPAVESVGSCSVHLVERDVELDPVADRCDGGARDPHRLRVDVRVQPGPDADDPSSRPAADAWPPGAGATEERGDVVGAVGTRAVLDVVDLGERSLVAVDDLTVEEREPCIDEIGSGDHQAPALVAIMSGMAASDAIVMTINITSASRFV